MRNVLLTAGLIMLLAPVLRFDIVGAAQQQPGDAAIVAEFDHRLRGYVELHRRLEGPVATVAVSDDWQQVRAAIDALAGGIRAARKDAHRGDIFAPPVERWFRQRLAVLLKDCNTTELMATLNEENPEGLVLVPEVNASWPAEASLGPMPPQLLAGLPPLPDDLQYRFMDRDLVLWDAHANIIVDFIKQAMP
ncbi:MAG TPA: hypothetical protein VFJ02_25525 [Vicinamibacterales bacterium]|nr:hypothetical protein [Vicinamibacterales bacterium]